MLHTVNPAFFIAKVLEVSYLMVATRPNISWIVLKFSQYSDRANASHIAAVKLLFRYIEGTIDYTIPWSPTNRHLVMLALIGTVMQTTDTQLQAIYSFLVEHLLAVKPVSNPQLHSHHLKLSTCL